MKILLFIILALPSVVFAQKPKEIQLLRRVLLLIKGKNLKRKRKDTNGVKIRTVDSIRANRQVRDTAWKLDHQEEWLAKYVTMNNAGGGIDSLGNVRAFYDVFIKNIDTTATLTLSGNRKEIITLTKTRFVNVNIEMTPAQKARLKKKFELILIRRIDQ